MNKRNGFLDNASKDKSNCKTKILFEVMLRYYKIYDLDLGTVHSQVFYMLYVADTNFTYDEICQKVGIGLTTLKTYRKRYETLSAKIIEKGIID